MRDFAYASLPAQALEIAESLAAITDDAGSWPHVPQHDWADAAPYATDKVRQGYMPVYERIARDLGPGASVCEVGVWGGGSLATWQALFPGGIHAGVDCDESAQWPPGSVKIVMGQDDEALPARLLEASPGGYDLIVDDASHDGKLTRRTWELLWPLVRPGGYYVVEDWFVGLGLHPWQSYGDSMLRTAESFLPLLSTQDCDPDEITYRYGMCIMHRRLH